MARLSTRGRIMAVLGAGALSVGLAVSGAAAQSTGEKLSIELRVLRSTGATLASRQVVVPVGGQETVSVKEKNRTIEIETHAAAGNKAGCHEVELVVRDSDIDESGRFRKTTWNSKIEPCGPLPSVLGPKTGVRVRVVVTGTTRG